MDRLNVDPVMRGTPGGAQGRSSWEEGAPKAQYRSKAGKKKKTREAGVFFSCSHFVLDASSGSGLTQRSPTGRVYCPPYSVSVIVKLYVDRRNVDPVMRVYTSTRWNATREIG